MEPTIIAYAAGIIESVNKAPRRDTFRWTLTSLKAQAFLEDLLPYLIIKREHALIAIDFQKHLTTTGILRFKGQGMKRLPLEETSQIRDQYYQQIRTLNMRGKPLDTL